MSLNINEVLEEAQLSHCSVNLLNVLLPTSIITVHCWNVLLRK